MPAKLLNGREISAKVKSRVYNKIKETTVKPGLAVVMVGNDAASEVYVKNKVKACDECGIASFKHILDPATSEETLLQLISQLTADERVHGILVQLPLPAHIREEKVLVAIPPSKDVDAFHPFNVGRLFAGTPNFLPCTPSGIMELILESGISISGKRCVVVGRSNIVGKPMALMLLQAHGTVTICHSKTKDLAAATRDADILVVAVGVANMITGDMVKPGAVVIDVGMNRVDGKLCGDVDFKSVSEVAGYITPVPGGVGPMTIAMLMENTYAAAVSSNIGETCIEPYNLGNYTDD